MLEWAFITFLAISTHLQAQDECMAVTLYHESRGESLEGNRAVYDVIQNRSLASFSSSCSVIKAPRQFSFVNKNTSWQVTDEQMEKLREVKKVKRMLDYQYRFYHNLGVSPSWSRKGTAKKVIGSHVFMELKEN